MYTQNIGKCFNLPDSLVREVNKRVKQALSIFRGPQEETFLNTSKYLSIKVTTFAHFLSFSFFVVV